MYNNRHTSTRVLCNQSNPSKLIPAWDARHVLHASSLQLIRVAPVTSWRTGGRDEEGKVRGGFEREVTEDSDTKGHPLSAAHSVTTRPQWPANRTLHGANKLQAVPTVTAVSQPGLITVKWCYLCALPCEPHTDKDLLIKPPFQQINNVITEL